MPGPNLSFCLNAYRLEDLSKDRLVRKTLDNYSGDSNLMHNEKVRELIAAGETIYHFGFGQSPFPIIDKAAERLSKHASKTAYLPVAGIKDLRQAICDFHKRYDDISLSPDDVIVGPGSKELIFLLMNIFEGDIDTHPKFLESEVFSKVKILILNNPDNPTGTFYTEEELIALRDVCRQHKVIILADEIYARLTYASDFTSMTRVYPEGTVLCSGMSKWASMGGWRLGYHIFPPELTSLKNAVKNAASQTYTSVASLIQYAITEVLQDHATCESYMFHTTRIMAAVAKYCHGELTAVGVKAIIPKGGYFIFPNFEVLRDTLQAQGIYTCEEMVDKPFRETAVSKLFCQALDIKQSILPSKTHAKDFQKSPKERFWIYQVVQVIKLLAMVIVFIGSVGLLRWNVSELL